MTDEADPPLRYSCPRCFSGRIKRRQSILSTSLWVGAFIALFVWIAGSFSSSSAPGALIQILFFLLFVTGIGAVMAPFSLAFGKNRCKDCGHKWR